MVSLFLNPLPETQIFIHSESTREPMERGCITRRPAVNLDVFVRVRADSMQHGGTEDLGAKSV